MKKLFTGYYRPSAEEFSALWDSAFFVFDTNVLLNLYRYTPKTTTGVTEILLRLQERLWLPHQVAFEFLRNRLEVIYTQQDAYSDIERKLDAMLKSLNGELGKYKKHPFIDINSIIVSLTSSVDLVKARLQDVKKSHPDFLTVDPIWDSITQIFNNNVGEAFSEEKSQQIYKDAEQRYNRKIPPGYEDAKNKPSPEKYSDVIIWYQILDFARTQKKPIIFVTGDSKSDWWAEFKGKNLGPRPELIQEFHAKVGLPCYIYNIDKFITLAQPYLGIPKTPDIIKEIFNLRQNNAFLFDEDTILLEDVNGDGKSEVILLPRNKGKLIEIYNVTDSGFQEAKIENFRLDVIVEKIFFVDIDGDNILELVCELGFDTYVGLIIYKYINGEYRLIRAIPLGELSATIDLFPDARIEDIDSDQQLEVISEPWDEIPTDLIPDDYISPHPGDEILSNMKPWGRTEYVWRWSNHKQCFIEKSRRLLYIGGR